MGAHKEKGENTYSHELGGTEAGATVKPVIVTELVNLDALLVGCSIVLRLCHRRGCRRPVWDSATLVADEERLGPQRDMFLPNGELGIGQAEDSESRHLI